MVEVGVNWEEIAGSKLSLVDSSFQMARDLFLIRFAYLFGIWKVRIPEGLKKR